MRKLFLISTLFLAIAQLNAASFSLNGVAHTGAQDNTGAAIPAGAMVMFIADIVTGDAFNDLITANSLDVTVGDSLEVGAEFGGYEIIGFGTAAGAPDEGSFLSGITIDYGASTDLETLAAGDQFALVWFDGISAGETVITSDHLGTYFGITTDDSWLVQSSGSLTFTDNEPLGSGEAARTTNAEPRALKEISAVPEPAAFGIALGIFAFLAARRLR